MSEPFVKIYGAKLLRSTLWLEAPEARLVFLGMLALADWQGYVEAPSGRVLAQALNLPVDYVQRALDVLEAPDPESRSPEHEGRRVLRVAGGWQLVNYQKYRETRSPKQIADADRQRRHREQRDKRDMSQRSQPVATDLRSENSDLEEEKSRSAPAEPSLRDQIQELEKRYDAELTAEAREACAQSRRNGKMADTVWLRVLRQLAAFDGAAVEHGLRQFVERHSDGEKNEQYMLGIVRGEARRLASGGAQQRLRPVANGHRGAAYREFPL